LILKADMLSARVFIDRAFYRFWPGVIKSLRHSSVDIGGAPHHHFIKAANNLIIQGLVD